MFPEIQIQLMRADRVGGREHLLFAAKNATRAFAQNRQRSHSLAVELLVYASCQRQISNAIQILGVRPETRDIVLAALSANSIPLELIGKTEQAVGGSPDDTVIEILSKEKAKRLAKVYQVTPPELEGAKLPGEDDKSVLKRLIIERSALLSVQD